MKSQEVWVDSLVNEFDCLSNQCTHLDGHVLGADGVDDILSEDGLVVEDRLVLEHVHRGAGRQLVLHVVQRGRCRVHDGQICWCRTCRMVLQNIGLPQTSPGFYH